MNRRRFGQAGFPVDFLLTTTPSISIGSPRRFTGAAPPGSSRTTVHRQASRLKLYDVN